jgi:peptide/nickel transport system ATP-binding protein
MRAPTPILQVENLTVAFRQGKIWQDVLRNFSFSIEAGQSYGLVGESGSGKTTLAMAIMSYLGENGRVLQGSVVFDGRDLVNLGERERRQIWGDQVALVPQNPLSSLNPTIRIGEQIAEILCCHRGFDKPHAAIRAQELLQLARLPDPQRIAQSYPHQLSGGMQQRVLIAMAVSTQPRLLILDEPTTSLDVTTQASILDLIKELVQGSRTAILYVSHNLGVIAQICHRVAVVYAGELVEDANLEVIFSHPLHPYTRGLLDSLPVLGERKHANALRMIPGILPPPGKRSEGCVFAARCPLAIEICQERPPLFRSSEHQMVRCHRWQEISLGKITALFPLTALNDQSSSGLHDDENREAAQDNMLVLDRIGVNFDLGSALPRLFRKKTSDDLTAVKDISLSIGPQCTMGLVGESGSGKTTLAKTVVGLVERTSGEIRFYQLPLPARLADRSPEMLKRLQLVFQSPEEAINPYKTIGASVSRPFIRLMKLSGEQAKREAQRQLEMVKLPADYAQRMPDQLSGGEKQRVAIARAFAVRPELLIVDEPVSSLDASLQAFILSLITDLQKQYGTALLLISHDLAVVGYLADRIAVIYLGQLMEIKDADLMFMPPYHPYTEALLTAFPRIPPNRKKDQIQLKGDIPSPIARPTGCPFHPRCPRYLGEICKKQEPPWQTDPGGQRIYCHIPLDQLAEVQKPVVPGSS